MISDSPQKVASTEMWDETRKKHEAERQARAAQVKEEKERVNAVERHNKMLALSETLVEAVKSLAGSVTHTAQESELQAIRKEMAD